MWNRRILDYTESSVRLLKSKEKAGHFSFDLLIERSQYVNRAFEIAWKKTHNKNKNKRELKQ